MHTVVRSTFPSQHVQSTPLWTTFGSCDVKKVHAVVAAVARSICPSQNLTKHTMFGTLFRGWDAEKVYTVVARSKCHVKNVKNRRSQTTFGSSDVVLRGRCKGFCTLSKASKAWDFCRSFNYNHHYTIHYNFNLPLQLHYLHYSTLHYTPLQLQPPLHNTTLQLQARYFTLHYTRLHCSTLHHPTLHYITLHYVTLRYVMLHYITLHHHKDNCNYTTLITIHNSTTLQIQLQLQYTTLHPAVVGEVTTATIATTPKTQLQLPSGPSVDSLCIHASQQPTSPIGFLFWNFHRRTTGSLCSVV